MDAERNKANLQRLYEQVMNGHDVDAADWLITPDRPDHDATFPPEFTRDREGFKQLFRMLIGAFPDLRFNGHHRDYGNDVVDRLAASFGDDEVLVFADLELASDHPGRPGLRADDRLFICRP